VPGVGRAKGFQRDEQWLGVVTPIRLGTFTADRPIVVGHDPYGGNESPDAAAFSPDGATAWVAYPATNRVIPVSTATGRPGKPIRTGSYTGTGYFPMACAVTPDGKWVYVSTGWASSRSGPAPGR
jgi:DNA-binding beta-propeller fold protein YncE